MRQAMQQHKIVSQVEWIEARKAHLAREKELTRKLDRLREERRALPWVKVEKDYIFDGPDGKVSLAALFQGRSQLVVQHFMFGPGWKEGCIGCSFAADHVDAARQHFEQKDVSFVAVARAPYPELAAFKQRMGWHFLWVSSFGNDFNYDFGVSFTPEQVASGAIQYNYSQMKADGEEQPGVSVFYKNERGEIFHTYSAYARGDESTIGAYAYLDLVPKGRDENGPGFNLGDWVKLHDKYETPSTANCCATRA
jgi:predicted dithiol-disulfide oxidoreductase (DUF899 family)